MAGAESRRVICPACGAGSDGPAEYCLSCGTELTPQSPSSVKLGSVIADRYELLARLGRGGMGVVYKAHDRTLDETVAIKLLRPEVAGQPEMARRFRSEIKLARKVRHENVCGIHEYGEDGALRYIAMEHVEGVNLRELLRQRGTLSAREAFDISIQAAQGLQAVHDAGIIHRDLKSSNLMRDSQGFVRLMDFGIAKRQGSDATIDGRVSGTPEYMSPEQARGKPLDHRSDIYALAVVIYELFTGRVPFKADAPVETALKHLTEPPPLSGPAAERLPASLLPVLRKGLAKPPAERQASAQELVRALQEARAAAGLEPPPPAVPAVPGAPSPTLAAAEAVAPTLAELTAQPGATDTHTALATLDARFPTERAQLPATQRPSLAVTARAVPRRAPPLALLFTGALLASVLALWLIDHPGRNANGPAPTAVPAGTPTTVDAATTKVSPVPAESAAPAGEVPPPPPVLGTEAVEAAPPAASEMEPAPDAAELATPLAPEPAVSVVIPPVPAPPEDARGAELPPSPPVPEFPSQPILLPASVERPVPDPGNRRPLYPEAHRTREVDAQVFLKVVVSAAGVVEDVQVLAGDPAFADPALAAARDWRFSPTLVAGRPTAVSFVVKVPFQADGR